jgi:choline-glycine betaine transporter
MLAKVLIRVGTIWMWAAIILIVVGYFLIAVRFGIMKLIETMSPFNISNYIVMLATFAPGYFLVRIGRKISEEKKPM